MTLPCETVKDLLPLYHDGVCSEASRELVSRHLETCEGCRAYLADLQQQLQVPDTEADTAAGLRSIEKKIKKKLLRSCLKGGAIGALIIAVLLGALLGLTQWRWLPVSAYGVQVAEIYQLEDGRILYRLDFPGDAWASDWRFETHEDGSDYKTPLRAVIELNQLQGRPSQLEEYQMIDPAENNAWEERFGSGIHISKWYWGHPEDCLLIYEEGMELPPAPPELEAKFG